MNSSCPIWHLGPCHFFGAALPSSSICYIFLQGPSHTSCFWGESPLLMSKHSLRTSLLTRLHKISDVIAPELAKRKVSFLFYFYFFSLSRSLIHSPCHFIIPLPSFPPSSPLRLPATLKIESLNFNKQPIVLASPDDVIFSFNAHNKISETTKPPTNKFTKLLFNVAYLSVQHSSNATIYGNGVAVAPRNFSDNTSRVGGVCVFLPLVNASFSSSTLSASLQLIGAALHNHHANLETMQTQGGYKMLALLLRQKRQYLNLEVLNACFSIAVDGFNPNYDSSDGNGDSIGEQSSKNFLLVDWDAMKYLLLNHQVRPCAFCLLSILTHPST